MKGKKSCPKCDAVSGARTIQCKCGYRFIKEKKKQVKRRIKKRKKKNLLVDVKWRDLRSQDIIKVFTGSGPYYDNDGEKIYVGESGWFRVVRLDKAGILVRRHGGNDINAATRFLYMGEPKFGMSGSCLEPYKIKQLIKKE